ncbi:MAG: hypothetical protein V4713_06930 [Pseudomonadota bacterium]
MSIALFAIPDVLAPLHGLWRRFKPAASPRSPSLSGTDQRGTEFAIHSIATHPHYTRATPQNSSNSRTNRPLRVVRVLEAGQAPAQVGRMLISGRMADVCAELDRLVAREAALH